jgi:ferredoxin-fold anticodon binding domain-containing protein
MGFIQNRALHTVRAMLDTRTCGLLVPQDADEELIADQLNLLAHVVMSAITWVYVSRQVSWISNTEWTALDDELKCVDFHVAIQGGGDDRG